MKDPKSPYLYALYATVLTLAATVIGGIILANHKANQEYNRGKTEGGIGKKAGFDTIPIQIDLNGTRWDIAYEDLPLTGRTAGAETPSQKPAKPGTKPTPLPSATPFIRTAWVEFNQYGSRLVGEASDAKGRRWIIEGAVAERRVCYIYYDSGSQLSFGSVCVEMSGDARSMKGKWSGWSPESNQPQPRNVTLTRQ